MKIKNEFDLPQEVFNIILKETANYNPVGVNFLMAENKARKYGAKELLIRFGEGNVSIIGEEHLKVYENSEFIQARAALIGSIYIKYIEQYPWIKDQINLVVPFAFSDTADTQLQDIPCIAFSKRAYSNNILIPSVNNLLGYSPESQIEMIDIPLKYKVNKMCFVGSFTDTELKDSTRLQIAKLAAKDPERFFCRIVRPPNFNEDEYNKIYYLAKSSLGESAEEILINSEKKIQMDQQLPYKYQLCVDGVTCPWQRLPWQMRANCIPIKIRNRHYEWKEWFYPLLDRSLHFLEVDIDDIVDTFEYIKENPEEQIRINEAGKEFVSSYLSKDIAEKYLIQTLLILSAKFRGIQ